MIRPMVPVLRLRKERARALGVMRCLHGRQHGAARLVADGAGIVEHVRDGGKRYPHTACATCLMVAMGDVAYARSPRRR